MSEDLLPREKLEKYGSQNLSDAELIAVILRQGTKGINVFEASKRLIEKYKSLTVLVDLPLDVLSKEKGIGKVKALNLKAAFELGKRFHLQKMKETHQKITCPDDVYHICEDMIYLTKETVRSIFLDSKLNIIDMKDISNGTANMSIAHPRDIFREAIICNAVSLILVHNHPSGDPTPSVNDRDLTDKISDSGKILGINMNDHIIIGKDSYFSFSIDRRVKVHGKR
ncbi:DNA repair protein RadC [Petrotoga sp. 9PWA.NaAc.5.4]|uniref:RadC family protein n=1 Tax=Petrotoga sp. 9PWA.NaAc.5.4 TaxID=1434328 RepID=UPI000CAE706D|nr:DNA repair protein RadC [Petrotoga sp. 9PWA.NaAc.5.4]PNR95646.1 DNA repair protein RadC [Petrotoga sp. 9PWA.NaAc.5.4]